MSEKVFTKGQSVSFTTIHGRKGKGKIIDITKGAKGDFIKVQEDGSDKVTSCRPAQLKAA
ncbi:hypothetical protein VL04_17455 [Chromobacterium violaceum]|uniref:hypothetical protein n=1 Tax=Chromobacterium violaceum TaxID=536 RepID=UPI0005BC2FD3|nr:hypothetical protein [Chromobacterium violaceum]KMN48756.1 hypothetical protein VK93_14720 [Chromobacterium violaceum]KMN87851.1 hypothetical protein VL02_00715 [Chromobacterium violaceum]KMN89080.1 hypothetical protein VL04_17455 [Chromobacterium violaceum]KMO05454.1 hypothetical protein VL16_02700 [Chromobacterium violaceum]